MVSISTNGTTTLTESYNALGWRVEAINCCGTVDYVHDAAGIMVGGSANAGAGTSTQYVYFRGGLLAQYWYGEGLWFAHLNALGSTQQFTDWTGANAKDTLFYPWGQPGPTGSGAYLGEMWAGFNEGNFWATSEWQTDTRRYTPGLGRWYTPDPIGKAAARLDFPQTWNMYTYVQNNPTTLTDPSGETYLTHIIFKLESLTSKVGEEIAATTGLLKAPPPPVQKEVPRPGGPKWTFKQSTGSMDLKVGVVTVERAGTGYAGHGNGLNNPEGQGVSEDEDKANAGPLPRGQYTIGPPTDHIGPVSMNLHPDPGTDMDGRGENSFWIHGDNASKPPFSSSEGCIVLPRDARESIVGSGINTLDVVP